MIYLDLIKQNWEQTFRSKTLYKNLLMNIIYGIFGLYFAVIFVLVGIGMGGILEGADDVLTPFEVFNGATLYIVLSGLLIRYLLQSIDRLNITPLLTLPIKRRTIIHYILTKPIFKVLNYVILFIIVPFGLNSVLAYHSSTTTSIFILSWVLIIWTNIWLTTFLKRVLHSTLKGIILLGGILGGFIALEYFNIFSLYDFSGPIFNHIMSNWLGTLLLTVMVMITYGLNLLYFQRNHYAEKQEDKIGNNETKITNQFSFLQRFGVYGELSLLQIKLILRHKRSRSVFIASVVFLFYGLLFYLPKTYAENNGILFFASIFVTGAFAIMYGQWVISWDASHFDSILTSRLSSEDYIKASYYWLLLLSIGGFILTSPYFFLGKKLIFLHLAAFAYNTGIGIPTLLFLATYNNKRIELNQGSAFNYQGTTWKNFIAMIPVLGVPVLLVWVLNIFFTDTISLIIVASIGAISILFHKPILKLTVKQFNNRKYFLAEGFRDKD